MKLGPAIGQMAGNGPWGMGGASHHNYCFMPLRNILNIAAQVLA